MALYDILPKKIVYVGDRKQQKILVSFPNKDWYMRPVGVQLDIQEAAVPPDHYDPVTNKPVWITDEDDAPLWAADYPNSDQTASLQDMLLISSSSSDEDEAEPEPQQQAAASRQTRAAAMQSKQEPATTIQGATLLAHQAAKYVIGSKEWQNSDVCAGTSFGGREQACSRYLKLEPVTCTMILAIAIRSDVA